MLTWSANCVLLFNAAANQATTIEITDTKPYVSVVTLSIQDNAKLLKQLKSGFKRIINWNKYQSKTSVQTQNQYLDHLVDPSYQGANRLFLLHQMKMMPTEQIIKDTFFQLWKYIIII